jgi:inhibitor of KinA
MSHAAALSRNDGVASPRRAIPSSSDPPAPARNGRRITARVPVSSLQPLAFVPLGDAAILIEAGDAIGADVHERVLQIVGALDAAPPAGLLDIVPAYTSVAVHFDCAALTGPGFERTIGALRRCIAQHPSAGVAEGRLIEIGVHYGGADGPDLEHVARTVSLTADEVIALHSGAGYRVAMIGFAPGFPYLAGLPPQLAVPRRATPRTRVAAGSVGIAGEQTGIYPLATPGGWQIIGRTDSVLFSPHGDAPTLLRLGDRVRFSALP